MRGEQTPATPGGDSVVAVLDRFLTWCTEHRGELTTKRYREFIQDFVKMKPEGITFGLIPALQIHAGHITRWLSERPPWGPTTKRNAITALQRGFNWAAKNDGLPRNPILGMEKPEAKRRTEIVSPEEFDSLLAHASTQFRDLLVVSYDSGARPFEVKELEARHCRVRAIPPRASCR